MLVQTKYLYVYAVRNRVIACTGTGGQQSGMC